MPPGSLASFAAPSATGGASLGIGGLRATASFDFGGENNWSCWTTGFPSTVFAASRFASRLGRRCGASSSVTGSG